MEFNEGDFTVIPERELETLRHRCTYLEDQKDRAKAENLRLGKSLAASNHLLAEKTEQAESRAREMVVLSKENWDLLDKLNEEKAVTEGLRKEVARLNNIVDSQRTYVAEQSDEARKFERDAAHWKRAYEAERRTTEFLTNWDTQQKFINKLQKAHEEEYRMRLALQEKTVADHKEIRGLRAEVEEYVRLKNLAEDAADYWREKCRELEIKHEDDPTLIEATVLTGDMKPGTYGWIHPDVVVRNVQGAATSIYPMRWVFKNRNSTYRVALYCVDDNTYRVAEEIEIDES